MLSIFFVVGIVLCALVIFKDILLIILFRYNFKSFNRVGSEPHRDIPFVSVLIAARNEENNIVECIQSLISQDYGTENFEILIGNDRSEDQTLKKLRILEKNYDNVQVTDIKDLAQKKHGKMNTLAQLGARAQGDFLLFTDADTRVNKIWIRTMVGKLKSGYGIVTGTTLLSANNLFGRLQNVEWTHAIGMMKVISDLGINVSSIGNNMGASRTAYDEVGGFQGIPFSITEDYEFFRQVCNQGYNSFHLFQPDILAFSLPSPSLGSLLMQRKRWMFGAFRLPILMLSILILNTVYFPLAIFLTLLNWQVGAWLVVLKALIQATFILIACRRLDRKPEIWPLIAYEFYSAIINLWALLLFMLPVKVKWKGRYY